MPVFGLGDPVVPDYLVLVLLLVGFLLAGLVRLVAHLMSPTAEETGGSARITRKAPERSSE